MSNLLDRRAKCTNFKLVAGQIRLAISQPIKHNTTNFFGEGGCGTKPEVELVLEEGGIHRCQGEV